MTPKRGWFVELVGWKHLEALGGETDYWKVGFIGAAGARGDVDQYEDESGIVVGGIGGQYLYRPQDNLWVGLDVAQGPEDTVLDIQVGNPW